MRHSVSLVLALLILTACGEAKKTLRFTAIPASNTTELEQKFAPLAEHLSEQLGIEVEYVPTQDYSASVEAFINGDVHLAWFGGLTGVRARTAVEGARAIAQGKVDPLYKSYFIANDSSGLKPGPDFPMALEGRRFTFGSNSSTSGRLMPEYFIRKFTGKSPQEFFGSAMNFSGAHDKTAQQVQAGTFEAGAMDYKTYDRLVAEKKIDKSKCIVIWTTPPYADYNWTAHPDLEKSFGPGFIDKLQGVLVGLDRPELLEAIDRSEGLIKARNEEWDALEKLARELDLLTR